MRNQTGLTEKQRAFAFVDLGSKQGLSLLRWSLRRLGFTISEYENYLGQSVCNLRFDYLYGHSEIRSSGARALIAASAHAHDWQYEHDVDFSTWPELAPWLKEPSTGTK